MMMFIQQQKERWFQNPIEQIRAIRFGVGLGLAFVLAVSFNWPLAIVTPILLSKLLSVKTKPLGARQGIGFLAVIFLSFLPFLILSHLAISQPVLASLLLFLSYYGIFYLSESDRVNPLVTIFLLLGITLIPLITLINSAFSIRFTFGFLWSALLAIIFYWVVYLFLPDPPGTDYEEKAKPVKGNVRQLARAKAFGSTLIIFPLALYFYATQAIGDVLILVFVALLAMNLDLVGNAKKGAMLVLSNAFGGILAWIIFMVLLTTPQLTFLTVLMVTACLIIGQYIFSKSPLAPFFAAGIATTIVLLGGVTGPSGGNFTEDYISRITQITLASGYIVLATLLIRGLLQEEQLLKLRNLAAKSI